MKSTFRKLGLTLFFLLSASISHAQLVEEGLSCKFIYPIQKGYLDQHISIQSADSKLRDHLIEQYIKRLDSSKIFFTQADVDYIRQLMSKVFDQVKSYDCSFLELIQKRYVERVAERVEFAKKLLDDKFKVDSSIEFEFDPDKRPYSKTSAEINEFLKKYINFQVANYLITDVKLDEARGNVVRNYERLLKRTQDKKMGDIYADYLDSFARALDPHSSFFSREVEEDFDIQMSLSLEGIGATLSSQDGFTVVEALVPGGAAARSGQIQPQDKIVAVAQGEEGKLENVIELDLRDVVSRIRGKKGTKVKLLILRKNADKKEKFEVTLVRDKIKLEDEAANIYYLDRVINGQKKVLGVINLPSFYAGGGRSSAADMKKLLVEAEKKKVDGIVLDLSSNGGGSLEDAVKIAGLFFKTGNVVKQSSRDAHRGELALADVDPTVDFSGPLVVLGTRISASASEIVAGTLQDYKRAVIVGGDHTFGKGSIQTVVRIPQDLGALKVTIGMFFIPGGNSTQHRGVEADIKWPSLWNSEEIGEKSLEYSLPPKKIANFVSKEAYVKDGPGAWKPIDTNWVSVLKEKSEQRVKQDSDFKKIQEDFTKAQKAGKLIKIAEILKDKEVTAEKQKKAKANKTAPKEEREKEYLGRADIKESLNVLADLVSLENGQKPDPFIPAKNTDTKPSKSASVKAIETK
ncbi:MAG: tail-specific protease [Pseudomonadota bacterium]|jgi:carboxyl-terminal processing protease